MAPLPSSQAGEQTGSEAFGLTTCCPLQTHLKLDQPLPGPVLYSCASSFIQVVNVLTPDGMLGSGYGNMGKKYLLNKCIYGAATVCLSGARAGKVNRVSPLSSRGSKWLESHSHVFIMCPEPSQVIRSISLLLIGVWCRQV